MASYGITYAINDTVVTAPDEEVWSESVIGIDLNGLQKRSCYKRLEWRKSVASPCYLDWFDYDNTALTSLTTRPKGVLDTFERYTTAICQEVSFRQRRSVGNEIVATFLVKVC